MSLKYSLFLSICLYLYLLIYEISPLISIIIIMFVILYRIKNWKALFFIFILIYFLVLPNHQDIPDFHEGRVIDIKENYVLVEHNYQKVLLYTHADLNYDEEITYLGDYQEIEPTYSFYSFNFKNYMKQKGVYYSCSVYDLDVVSEHHTLRNIVYKKIKKFDEEKTIYLKKIIFNISTSDFNELDILMNSGISLTGILYFIRFLLEKLIEEKRLNNDILCLNLILCIFYHFPFVLTQFLIFTFLKRFDFPYNTRIGLGYLVIMILYPKQITSISFLIPMLFRLFRDKKEFRFLILSILQSILFHEISIFKLLFFRGFVLLSGLVSFCAWISIFIPLIPIKFILNIYEKCLALIDLLCIKGSPYGIIFILFILCFIPLLKTKKGIRITTGLYYLFIFLGLFHPFGECTFLNVSQGMSILIRYPFNHQNILIDTGKERQYSKVKTYLESKSISTIHHLAITHYDEDHSGNIDNLKKDFHVLELNDTHEDISYKNINLYQINPISNDDTNESSLVFITKLNGLNYLIMGDATKTSEKEILKNYPSLSADIIQAGHHGSKTSSSEEFIETVQPSIGIFSCGNYSLYHHPSDEVVALFNALKIQTYNTYDVGDITIIFLPIGNLLITSSYQIMFLI